jgi:hypothetical protein
VPDATQVAVPQSVHRAPPEPQRSCSTPEKHCPDELQQPSQLAASQPSTSGDT